MDQPAARPAAPARVPLKVLLFSSPERQARVWLDALGSRYDDATVAWEAPGRFSFARRVAGTLSETHFDLPRLPRYAVLACQWTRAFARVWRLARGRPFDLFIVAGIQATLMYPLFRRVRAARRLVYWAGDWFPNDRWWAFLDRTAARLSDETWNLTAAIRQARGAAHGWSAERAGDLVPTLFAPPAPFARPEPAGTPCVCYLGRAWAGRGLDLAIAAMAQLRGRGITLDLVITGRQSDDDLRYARALVAEAGKQSQVRWTDFLPLEELNRLLLGCRAGLAVFPGGLMNYSNFTEPGKVSHCLQLGVPVILSRDNAMAAEIRDHGAGLLVEDAVGSLAAAMERFCVDPSFAREAGKQAHALAARRASPDALYGRIESAARVESRGEDR